MTSIHSRYTQTTDDIYDKSETLQCTCNVPPRKFLQKCTEIHDLALDFSKFLGQYHIWSVVKSFLAERCNLHCKVRLLSSYVVCLSVVCDAGVLFVTNQFKLVSRGFHWRQQNVSTYNMISFGTKFEENLPRSEFKLGWGGFLGNGTR